MKEDSARKVCTPIGTFNGVTLPNIPESDVESTVGGCGHGVFAQSFHGSRLGQQRSRSGTPRSSRNGRSGRSRHSGTGTPRTDVADTMARPLILAEERLTILPQEHAQTQNASGGVAKPIYSMMEVPQRGIQYSKA